MPARDLAQRIADTRNLLATEVDCWVASVEATGAAYLIPVSFYWDGRRLVIATPGNSRTARNLLRAGRVRLALGPTRDVVVVEGSVTELDPASVPELADGHAQHAGFDVRTSPGYVFLCVTPERIQAWRNPAELPQRDVMRNGRWLAED